MSNRLKGIVACIISGLGFGIYWMPIRALENAGLTGIWPVVIFSIVPLLFCLPLFAVRLRKMAPKTWRFHASGALAGVGYALYVSAYLYTDVIHAIVLYYLMPIWGFLLGWLVLGEKVTLVRWCAIMLALLGLAFLIPSETGIPFPRNLGDWMALAGGMMWATVALILYMGPTDPVDDTLNFLSWSVVASCVMAWISTVAGDNPFPSIPVVVSVLWWLVPLALLVVLPTAFATMYGPSQVSPGVAGLLFMIEISVGTVTAAILTHEQFGISELVGVGLIFVAGIAEPVQLLWQQRESAATA